MYYVLLKIVPVALFITWLCGQIALISRYCSKERLYVRHFPTATGIPFNLTDGFGPWNRHLAIQDALWQRLADPEVERLRRDVWRCLR